MEKQYFPKLFYGEAKQNFGKPFPFYFFEDLSEEFRNKDVIVLGSSYSAEDVALQCNKYGAKSVTIGYRHNPMGFKWPKGMKEVHYLDKLDGKKAIFKDGTEQDADVVILCTGYLHTSK